MKEEADSVRQANTAGTEAVIQIRDLKKSFGAQHVLKNVSLDLIKGENLIVLGKSGSGKSVLIKCIVQLMTADSGSINVLGQEVDKLKSKELAELRKKVGFLFQSGALYDSMTVKENLEFPLKRIKKDLSEKEVREKIMEALQNVGLESALNKMPSQLSGGMRKRIALARTIILDPAIMLYDEPTTGLDPITSQEISALINDIRNKYHTSSLVITHDMPCARAVADRVLILKEGEVYAEGTLEEVQKINDPWIQSFFKD
ncbi:MAG: Phospholipid/cholesterol/gamma-HCH transport system ATP-binding protein [Bacteroidetes bacterium]|nr:Phospholipid/cholesterol/gamma-HCH transport system ATP-binding protein [Bacteroidota bacterium]